LFVADTYDHQVERFNASSYCLSRTNCPGWEFEFGSKGGDTADVGMSYPHAVAFGADSVWIGDQGPSVSRWTTGGTLITRWGQNNLKIGGFQGGVQGIEFANGNVYTTSVLNCRLQIWDVAGNLLRVMGGQCGSGPNLMKAPRGIAVADEDTVYVAEGDNDRISVWDTVTRTATTLAPLCGGLPLDNPQDVVLDSSKEWLYVADAAKKRVVRIATDGTLQCDVVTTGAETPQKTLGSPRYLDFAPDGRLFVSTSNRRVYAFTISG
jgi:DNA-binding beta-propeller fold protein YncE